MTAQVRTFESGATRDLDLDKYDYDGFLSPLALEAFAAYMHKNRRLPDGSLRSSDNWKQGIPLEAYAKSEWRHHIDFWKLHHGLPAREDMVDTLCALLFNVQGYLHEYLKAGETKVTIAYDTATGDWSGSFGGIVAKVPPFVDDEDLGLRAGEAISAGGTD